ncbi:MAG: 4-(cytidine 5'-diphospho)-2-C-methyl-D-erythritol kinase [Candidatus Aminicenantes bacterium]|nr:MAG: 4-(cytidine 5'-diphospho)-2-C-methyl-D-erythritol kinase [Candidatus Aminicenantes bacterium]RLE04623.1 MAG: 4-(cytidine 5'-diphospho)-2-C-methyl-D-erythritol kinase [Candidatus Aminicenantes bacterium]HHF43296.1 4-(cytidine 5'-diphospho)-2-C-methyl-D-erythritol kinase [Candidatus Aminicenantes bacterium]
MKLLSPAKINLALEVLGRREDGYHDLLTLFQSISLADEIELVERKDGGLQLAGDEPSISWGEDNLIFQAVLKMKQRAVNSPGVEIKVRKRIPPGAGLGGGSSNAAVVLMALNQLWQVGLTRQELIKIGQELGADVPYFFHGGLCLGQGRGDLLQPLPDLEERAILLVLPPWGIATRWVFEQLPPTLTSSSKVSKINQFLKDNNLTLLVNELEGPVFARYPRLRKIKEVLKEREAELSLMSGSGSALYGMFKERNKAVEFGQEIEGSFPEVKVTIVKTLSRSQYWEAIGLGV